MAEMKPLASLSSGLLARKGQARPAMRRQGMDVGPTGPASLDDLGWNDMGWDEGGGEPPASPPPSPAREAIQSLREAVEAPAPEPANPATLLTPEPAARVPEPVARAPEPVERVMEAEAETTARSEPTRIIPPIALRRARQQARSRDGRTATGKAAFTLRLDADRHLKLRLAAALERQSAQTLVTRALDRFLDGFHDLDQLLGDRPRDKD